MFIHDALSELVVCGETDIPAANIRISIDQMKELVVGEALTVFQKQFKVIVRRGKITTTPTISYTQNNLLLYYC